MNRQTEVHKINVIFKWALITAGIVFIAAGVITFWLPIPIGIPLLDQRGHLNENLRF